MTDSDSLPLIGHLLESYARSHDRLRLVRSGECSVRAGEPDDETEFIRRVSAVAAGGAERCLRLSGGGGRRQFSWP